MSAFVFVLKSFHTNNICDQVSQKGFYGACAFWGKQELDHQSIKFNEDFTFDSANV